jgi:CheY-like chemotaxis protein
MSSSLKPEQPLRGIEILLVEDEFDIAYLLVFILGEAGAKVVLATYATEALRLLETHDPDILLCNLRLPDRHGSWLIKQIRAREVAQGKHLPAIAVTSYTREVSKADVLKAGFHRFLDKPIDADYLVAEVLRLVELSKEEYRCSFISNSRFLE